MDERDPIPADEARQRGRQGPREPREVAYPGCPTFPKGTAHEVPKVPDGAELTLRIGIVDHGKHLWFDTDGPFDPEQMTCDDIHRTYGAWSYVLRLYALNNDGTFPRNALKQRKVVLEPCRFDVVNRDEDPEDEEDDVGVRPWPIDATTQSPSETLRIEMERRDEVRQEILAELREARGVPPEPEHGRGGRGGRGRERDFRGGGGRGGGRGGRGGYVEQHYGDGYPGDGGEGGYDGEGGDEVMHLRAELARLRRGTAENVQPAQPAMGAFEQALLALKALQPPPPPPPPPPTPIDYTALATIVRGVAEVFKPAPPPPPPDSVGQLVQVLQAIRPANDPELERLRVQKEQAQAQETAAAAQRAHELALARAKAEAEEKALAAKADADLRVEERRAQLAAEAEDRRVKATVEAEDRRIAEDKRRADEQMRLSRLGLSEPKEKPVDVEALTARMKAEFDAKLRDMQLEAVKGEVARLQAERKADGSKDISSQIRAIREQAAAIGLKAGEQSASDNEWLDKVLDSDFGAALGTGLVGIAERIVQGAMAQQPPQAPAPQQPAMAPPAPVQTVYPQPAAQQPVYYPSGPPYVAPPAPALPEAPLPAAHELPPAEPAPQEPQPAFSSFTYHPPDGGPPVHGVDVPEAPAPVEAPPPPPPAEVPAETPAEPPPAADAGSADEGPPPGAPEPPPPAAPAALTPPEVAHAA